MRLSDMTSAIPVAIAIAADPVRHAPRQHDPADISNARITSCSASSRVSHFFHEWAEIGGFDAPMHHHDTENDRQNTSMSRMKFHLLKQYC